MNDRSRLLEKAARSLEVAQDLLQKGHIDFAASRVYYAYFHTAEALLLSQGLEFSSHGRVVAQYGRLFSKTKILDPSFHQLLAAALDLRHIADYQTEVPIKPEIVEELLEGGRKFLEAASRYLEELPAGAEGGESGED
jgi:uncharacterized protein (UPF0332 family)